MAYPFRPATSLHFHRYSGVSSPVARADYCLGFNNVYGRHTQALCQLLEGAGLSSTLFPFVAPLTHSGYHTLDRLSIRSSTGSWAPSNATHFVKGGNLTKGSPQHVSMSIGVCWDISGLNWPDISHLRLNQLTHHQVLEILDQAPNLEDLGLLNMRMKSALNFPPSTIVLSSLQNLLVYCVIPLSKSLVDHISCPNLNCLEWHSIGSPLNFITRCSCPLTDFTLLAMDTNLEELFQLFDAMPLLT